MRSPDPLGDGISRLELVSVAGSDQSVVAAARVSLGHEEDQEGAERLITYMLKHGHWSPFEHASLTLRVACPIFVARQWMRHRSWSFNELSRRYTSDDIEFHTVQSWRSQGATNRQASGEDLELADQMWCDLVLGKAYAEAARAYRYLLERGVAREQARIVLPVGLYTRFYATCNLRSALHFYGLRATEEAQGEIHAYAEELAEVLAEHFPITWQAYNELGVTK